MMFWIIYFFGMAFYPLLCAYRIATGKITVEADGLLVTAYSLLWPVFLLALIVKKLKSPN